MTVLRRLVLVSTFVVSGVVSGLVTSLPTPRPVSAAACGGAPLTAAQLTDAFSRPGLGGAPNGGFAGGDYQHVYPLPDGRNLWLLQDVFFSADDDLRDSLTVAAHSAGFVQDGSCWTMLGGPNNQQYLGASLTVPKQRWFWPLDGDMGADGMLWVFAVEMRNPYGTGAATGAAPVATWVARIDPVTLQVRSFTPAADAGTRLYGWSITSDDSYHYLYGHCYRQFVTAVASTAQFDPTCMPHTYLARVPKGRFDLPREYWTAGGWSADRNLARPVMTRGAANPMDVQRVGDIYVNVTKVDDWWGLWLHIDKAPNPWGPWETDRSEWVVDDLRCTGCGIYHAHLLPWRDPDGSLIVSLSNGGDFPLWQRNASLYRPSFLKVPVPTYRVDQPVVGAGLTSRAAVRAIDTRTSGAPVRGGTTLRVPLAGKVAAGSVGAVVNLTAVAPSGVGYLTAWACGARMPVASSLNYRAGRTLSNAAHIRLGSNQELCVYTWADTHVVVDVTGSYTATGGVGLRVMDGVRIDSTIAGGVGAPLAAETVRTVVVAGRNGVPTSGVGAVSVTVTASQAADNGYMVVWPCGQSRPTAASLTLARGDTVSNAVVVPLGSGGAICVASSTATHVDVDLAGWWSSSGSRARLSAPYRAHDSRPSARLAAGVTTPVTLGSLPTGTRTVIGNLTAVAPSATGRIAVSDCGVPPSGSVVSHPAGETRAGVVVAELSTEGRWCVGSVAATHLVVDVTVTFT